MLYAASNDDKSRLIADRFDCLMVGYLFVFSFQFQSPINLRPNCDVPKCRSKNSRCKEIRVE